MRVDLNGRRALVTGGASGIGLAAAELLVSCGAQVAVLDISDAVFAAAEGIGAVPFVADTRDPTAVDGAVDAAADALGGACDLLVNSAGVYRIRPSADLDPDAWADVLAINLTGPVQVTRSFHRRLGPDAPAAVVNVSSIGAYRANATEPALHYRASKGGLTAAGRQLAVEWGPRVRVNTVSPGVVATPMVRMMDDREAGTAFLNGHVPARRLGTPREVANVVVFLLSDLAAYVTGADVVVDGGLTAC